MRIRAQPRLWAAYCRQPLALIRVRFCEVVDRAPARGKSSPPDVTVVSIDTLRADEYIAGQGMCTAQCYSYSIMPKLPSRATLILNGAGITVTQVAAAAGIAQPSVSAQFAGRRLLQDKTFDAIRRLAGQAVADEVHSATAKARSAYLLEAQAGRM